MYEIEYNGEKIPYKIINSKIKNMYIYIKDGNVIVKVPNKLKERYAIDFVNQKAKNQKVKKVKTLLSNKKI